MEALVLSDKLNIPTFEVHLIHQEPCLDGPVVAPDKLSFASDLPDIDQFVRTHQALLVYDKRWHYIPFHQIRMITKGKQRFALPWPLV
jgi:hypothetical protein